MTAPLTSIEISSATVSAEVRVLRESGRSIGEAAADLLPFERRS